MSKKGNGERQHGRHARKPAEVPKAGWLDILWRVKNEISLDHVSLVAAGIAFYGFLAIFPAIAAVISIWGLLFQPEQLMQQISSVSHLLPEQASQIIRQQAQKASAEAATGMGLTAIGGILLTLYSASKGMAGMMEGLNITYDEEESRGFIKKKAITLGLTLGAILMTVVALGAIAAVPAIVSALGMNNMLGTLINLARWPLLLIIVMLALAMLYRLAPDRDRPRWQWTSVGSIIAVLVWLAGSIAFSVYVKNFSSYNETYGALGAIVILLMWFWLSAFIVLIGAELNSEIEHQTAEDTTVGKKEAMGSRDAHVADTLGKPKDSGHER